MKKILLSLLLVSAVGANAQTTIFEDSFETYTDFAITGVGNWTLVDVDGRPTFSVEQGADATSVTFPNVESPMAFIVMNSTASSPALDILAWGAKTGDKCMAAMGAVPGAGVTANNDYLISPQIQLGTSGNTVKFWAKSISTDYPEKFKVSVSTTGVAPANFTVVSATAGVIPTTSWVEYTYALDAYAGQNVRIAVQCVSSDAFALLIDDFKVSATVLGTADFFKSNFAVYPNPVSDVLHISNANNLDITNLMVTDINGRIVKQVNAPAQSINVGELSAGIYFLKVTSAEGEGVTKFIRK